MDDGSILSKTTYVNFGLFLLVGLFSSARADALPVLAPAKIVIVCVRQALVASFTQSYLTMKHASSALIECIYRGIFRVC